MGISPADFQRLQQRLGGRRKREAPEGPPELRRFSRILGIDPSLRGTGFGVIEVSGGKRCLLEAGTLRCPAAWVRSRCLARIAVGIREAIRRQAPEVCAVEGLFFAQNLRTALTLGEARGAALAAVAEAGLPIHELAPRQIKQAVVGFGGAQKLAVGRMVQRLLGVTEALESDAADALAVALALFQASQGTAGRRLKRL